jgi:anti-sigma-K factor RskA
MAHLATTSDWRDLARRIQDEKDPAKMIALVQELIAQLEAAQLQKTVQFPVRENSAQRPS